MYLILRCVVGGILLPGGSTNNRILETLRAMTLLTSQLLSLETALFTLGSKASVYDCQPPIEASYVVRVL